MPQMLGVVKDTRGITLRHILPHTSPTYSKLHSYLWRLSVYIDRNSPLETVYFGWSIWLVVLEEFNMSSLLVLNVCVLCNWVVPQP